MEKPIIAGVILLLVVAMLSYVVQHDRELERNKEVQMKQMELDAQFKGMELQRDWQREQLAHKQAAVK